MPTYLVQVAIPTIYVIEARSPDQAMDKAAKRFQEEFNTTLSCYETTQMQTAYGTLFLVHSMALAGRFSPFRSFLHLYGKSGAGDSWCPQHRPASIGLAALLLLTFLSL